MVAQSPHGSVNNQTFRQPSSSSPSRSAEAKLRDVVSVLDFGAAADGSSAGTTGTTQTAAFQAANDYVSANGGGAILIPYAPGCYTIGYPGVQVSSGVTFYSDSRATCVQVLHAAYSSWPGGWAMFSNSLTASTTGLNDVHLRNFTLDGNRDNISGLGSNMNAIGVALYGASESSIEGMIIKNAGDGVYLDCSDSGRLTQGVSQSVRGNLVTNSQRNNISVICGTNIVVADNELSYANGLAPEDGIDVEENVTGQAVPGFALLHNYIHHNNQVGAQIIPAYDPDGTLAVRVVGNNVEFNGQCTGTCNKQGLYLVSYNHLNTITVASNNVLNNVGVQMLMSGWIAPVVAGNYAVGGAVGLSIGVDVVNAAISGHYSGSSYDIEITDSTSSGVLSGVTLEHGTINGRQYFTGSRGPLLHSADDAVHDSYIAVGAGTTVGNGQNYWCHDGTVAATGALTAQRCLIWDDFGAGGTYNIGAQGLISAGPGKYNLWMSGTARNYLASSFQTTPKNLSDWTADFPCNSDNVGMMILVNDATSQVGGSVVTGGGAKEGWAHCDSGLGSYIYDGPSPASSLTAGTGISISGSTISNTAPMSAATGGLTCTGTDHVTAVTPSLSGGVLNIAVTCGP